MLKIVLHSTRHLGGGHLRQLLALALTTKSTAKVKQYYGDSLNYSYKLSTYTYTQTQY